MRNLLNSLARFLVSIKSVVSMSLASRTFKFVVKTVFSSATVFLLLLGSLQADQNDEQLPGLFADLKAASSASDAQRLESSIWLSWLATDDEKSAQLLQRIVQAMEVRDMDEALQASDELVAHAPEFAEGWNKRATIYYLIGDYNASVRDIQRTLQLEPRHFGAISGLGLIFLQKGDLKAALESFESVLEISPQSLNAQRSAAQVRAQISEEI